MNRTIALLLAILAFNTGANVARIRTHVTAKAEGNCVVVTDRNLFNWSLRSTKICMVQGK